MHWITSGPGSGFKKLSSKTIFAVKLIFISNINGTVRGDADECRMNCRILFVLQLWNERVIEIVLGIILLNNCRIIKLNL